MDLTDTQRAKLTAIRDDGVGDTYLRDQRPTTKAAYREKRKRLKALLAAWDAIDHGTQMDIACSMGRMWQDERDDAPIPDLNPVISDLLHTMKMPGGRPEDIPGLTEATTLLWSVWCADRGGVVSIDRESLDAIGGEAADLFGITPADAHRRVRDVLRSLDKVNKLPHRKGYDT